MKKWLFWIFKVYVFPFLSRVIDPKWPAGRDRQTLGPCSWLELETSKITICCWFCRVSFRKSSCSERCLYNTYNTYSYQLKGSPSPQQGPLRAWWGRSWAMAFWPFGTRLTSAAQWNLGILKSPKNWSFQFVSIPEMRITIDHYNIYIYYIHYYELFVGYFLGRVETTNELAVSCSKDVFSHPAKACAAALSQQQVGCWSIFFWVTLCLFNIAMV